MFKMNKNFIYMLMPVAAFILGTLAVKHDIRSLFLVFGFYALGLLITQIKIKTIKPRFINETHRNLDRERQQARNKHQPCKQITDKIEALVLADLQK